MTLPKIIRQIAAELRATEAQVRTAVDLLDGGATVPFIARYRKEATGGLDDIQLRALEERLGYLRELEARRATVLDAIRAQGKLTPALAAAIDAAPTKQELEDLYLPYKQKRRTKGQIAREAGIEPLADALFADPTLLPLDEAAKYTRQAEEGADFSTPGAVLDGVRDILSERWAEDARLVQGLREWLWATALLKSTLAAGKDANQPDNAKFRDYFDYDEPIGRVPSHRALAVFRGRALEVLDAKLVLPFVDGADPKAPTLAEGRIAAHLGWRHQARAADDLLRKCVAWTWKVKLSLSTERDLFARLREDAEKVAIKVFADNLRDLLLAAPAGPRVVMGLDPGIRTGVKVAVVDATGKLVDTATVYPHEPRKDWDGALHTLAKLAQKHGVNLIAIGNGTASRETDKLAGDLIKLLERTGASRPTTRVRAEPLEASVLPPPVRAELVEPSVFPPPVRAEPGKAAPLSTPPVRAELVEAAPLDAGTSTSSARTGGEWAGSASTGSARADGAQAGASTSSAGPGRGVATETDAVPGMGVGTQTGVGTGTRSVAVIEKVVVSEAGASVYSASEFASQEMPDVDVSLRGAASIARRLQDPLAELVKIDPKSIGVGQYQHDVNQGELARTLDTVVEDCVNAVGVDVNTASAPLLARVAGLSGGVAKAVVRWREQHGAFASRKQLLEVAGLGPKAFEQSAGFLRIRGGTDPLDMTGVHPETYPVVQAMLSHTARPIDQLMGRADMLKALRPELFANERFGVITVKDILAELEKPGRDPRPDFKVARFNDGVNDIRDLKEGMVLEGTVSNVAAFGAFIDLGVHQDGLVHVSQLAHKFVNDAREVVKTGDIVRVRVTEVDVERKRIALTMKLDAAPARRDAPRDNRFEGAGRQQQAPRRAGPATPTVADATAMGSAFAKLRR